MKKQAATLEQVKFKQEEIRKILTDTLTKIKAIITPAASVNQISAQVNNLLTLMASQINKIVLEMASIVWTLQQQQATQQTQTADDGHLKPINKAENKKLPDFWRRNYDYCESPYMHMNEMKTITEPKKLSKRQ